MLELLKGIPVVAARRSTSALRSPGSLRFTAKRVDTARKYLAPSIHSIVSNDTAAREGRVAMLRTRRGKSQKALQSLVPE